MNTSSYIFHVHGMYCKSCVVLTETEVSKHPKVKHVRANLRKKQVEVQGDFGLVSIEDIAADLTALVSPYGYTISISKQESKINWSDFIVALPISLIFIFGFIILQKLGVVNWVDSSNINYGTAFIIGVIASVSTCMAVVGGLVLSVSSTFTKGGDKIKPQILFHAGRLITFFILGGVVGSLGSAFKLGLGGTFILQLTAGIVMLILGINLLEILPFIKRMQLLMPGSVSKNALKLKSLNHSLTPLLLGFATFFLPCGFTQSMQIYVLSTGSFIQGAMFMLVFALGTLPVLAILSFSSLSFRNYPKEGIFFKTAGLVVIFFAVFNILNSLAAKGIITPIFNF